MTVHIGIREIEFNRRLDNMMQDVNVHLTIEIYPGDTNEADYTRFMEAVNHAMDNREPHVFLLALLEATTGHTYRTTEEPQPGEPGTRLTNFVPLVGGRIIDLGG